MPAEDDAPNENWKNDRGAEAGRRLHSFKGRGDREGPRRAPAGGLEVFAHGGLIGAGIDADAAAATGGLEKHRVPCGCRLRHCLLLARHDGAACTSPSPSQLSFQGPSSSRMRQENQYEKDDFLQIRCAIALKEL